MILLYITLYYFILLYDTHLYHLYLQDLQMLQITLIHCHSTSWGRWGRLQGPLQGLTQPVKQNNENGKKRETTVFKQRV